MALLSMASAMATTHGYILSEGVSRTDDPQLRAFVLGDERQCQDMVLALVRVVPLAIRSYMLLFSDGVSCVWALAFDNASVAAELMAHGSDIHGYEYDVTMVKCSAADGPPYLLCRFISRFIRMQDAEMSSAHDSGSSASGQQRWTTSSYTVQGAPYATSLVAKPKKLVFPMHLLVCRGPRRVVAGQPERAELRMSSVDNVVSEIHGRERFFARLCVLGFYQPPHGAAARVVLTDGTHTILVLSSELTGVYRYNIVDVHGCSLAQGRQQRGVLEARVECFIVHFGTEKNSHVRYLIKHQGGTKKVSCWRPVGMRRPSTGRFVDSAAITAAVSAKRKFDLVEYHVLEMNEVQVDDFVLVGNKFFQAVRMPRVVPNTRSHTRHAVQASLCSTRTELGHSMHGLLGDSQHAVLVRPEVIEGLVVPLLSVLEVVRLGQVNKQLRLITVRVACAGRTHYFSQAPALFKRNESVYRLQYQVNETLRSTTRGTECAAPDVRGKTLVTRLFASFVENNLKGCVCGDSVCCLFCLARLDKHRSQRCDFTVAALALERAPPPRRFSSLQDLERLRLRHLNLLREYPEEWRIAHHVQAFVAAQDKRMRLCVVLETPELTSDAIEQHATHTLQWLQKRLQTQAGQASQKFLAAPVLGVFDTVEWWQRRLVDLHAARPLVPGSILLLLQDSADECERALLCWKHSALRMDSQYGPHDVVPMAFFAAPSDVLPTSRRIRVQLHSALFFKARVVYFASNRGLDGTTMIRDQGYFSFVGHDGENVMFFSTDCESFVEMLEHAVTTRELENDFCDCVLCDVEDPHAQNAKLDSCSVLQNYVVEMTVLAVQLSAMLSSEDMIDQERRLIFQWLCRDFKIIDSQHAPMAAEGGHLIADGLFHTLDNHVIERQLDEEENLRLDVLYESEADISVYTGSDASDTEEYDEHEE
jgi:hypothetical protein